MKREKGGKTKIMSRNGYRRYREELKKVKVHQQIGERDNVQDIYDELNRIVMQIKKAAEKEIKRKKDTPIVRQLMRIKRRIKAESMISDSEELATQRKLITQHIYEER